MRKVDVIVGAQYGSESKGQIAAHIADQYVAHIRVGSIQSGHTVWTPGADGVMTKFVMRTIPSGFVNKNALLLIGPGAFIEPNLLLDEIEMLKTYDPDVQDRLIIDNRTWMVTDADVEKERGMDKSMGSTCEGAGASLIRKMWRKGPATLACNDPRLDHLQFGDTSTLIDSIGDRVLLEGSQGTGLGLHTSRYYPFCTSRECTASNWLAEAGIGPTSVRDVIGVARTFPIRVGGNSGPTESKELTWEQIDKIAGGPISREYTTVTKRMRRIFEWDANQMAKSIIMNGITKLAVTFANYLDISCADVEDEKDLPVGVAEWFAKREVELNTPIQWTTTGPSTVLEFEV